MSVAFKLCSVLWAVWGVFHFVIGSYVLYLLHNGRVAEALFGIGPGGDSLDVLEKAVLPFVASQLLRQHAWNLLWFGAVTAVGSVYVWRASVVAVLICGLVGGLADTGYFMYIDLAGLAGVPGPQMTYIAASAIIAGAYGHYSSAASASAKSKRR